MNETNETTTKPSFIKADNDTLINEKCIRWIKKIDECLLVCSKSVGCVTNGSDCQKICNYNNPNSYNKLNKLFE